MCFARWNTRLVAYLANQEHNSEIARLSPHLDGDEARGKTLMGYSRVLH